MLRTGWTEDDLRAAGPATVAKMRDALYAEVHATAVALDVKRELEDLDDATASIRVRERIQRKRVAEARERLTRFRGVQALLRRALHLDDPEPIPEDAE